jgi:hypothetical protein
LSETTSSSVASPTCADGARERYVEPVTERILERLSGRRAYWAVAWAALAAALLVASAAPRALPGVRELAARGDWTAGVALAWARLAPLGPAILAMVYGIPHALWAVRWIVKRAGEASGALASGHLAGIGIPTLTRGMSSVAGPLVVAAALGSALVASVAWWRGAGYVAFAPVVVLVFLPQVTLLWVYLCLMLGLFRLGSRPLALEQYVGDRSLGLRPVGQLAFDGFLAFVSNFAPLTLLAFGGRSSVDLFVVSAFLLVGTFAIFASLLRLRAQMTAARQRQVARALQFYEEAFEPLRLSRSLETLARQAPLLAAAEALEKRADAIQRWPFSDAVLARVVVIATSVLAAVIARVAQVFLGL